MIALTKYFKDTIQARAQRDPAFRKALLQEGVECLLAGDIDTGKAVLRDYINATIGFEELSSQIWSAPSRIPTYWPANTVLKLIFRRPMQIRPY